MQDSNEWSENRKLADPVRVEMLELLDQGVAFGGVISRAAKRIQEGRLPKIVQQALCVLPVKYSIVKGAHDSSPPKFLEEYLRGSPRVSELAWASFESSFELVDAFEVIVSPECAKAWVEEVEKHGIGGVFAILGLR